MGNETELLGSVIEFSIGLAGFSGVVAAVTRNTSWTALEKYRVVNLLQSALLPAFLAFVALGLANAQDNSVAAWQQACVISALTKFAFVARAFWGRSALPAAQRGELRMDVMISITVTLSLAGVAQLLAATVLAPHYAFPLFYAGQLLLLMAGAILFMVAIFSARMASDESTE